MQFALQHLQLAAVQSSQCALCNRLHSVEERLSRWLLMIHDRAQGDHLELTHEFIANMLGTLRSGVTVAACTLRKTGLISLITYTRGCITVLDRENLLRVPLQSTAVAVKHGRLPPADR
jgi:CRP-like cAMP-binding protein